MEFNLNKFKEKALTIDSIITNEPIT